VEHHAAVEIQPNSIRSRFTLGCDDLIAPGLDWAGPRLFIIDDAKPLSDTIRLFWACLSNPHREPRPALPEACEVPSRASPCQAGRLGSGAGGNSCVEADPTRSLRTESGCTNKCPGHTEREWLRRDRSQDGQHWESPEIGVVQSPLYRQSDSQPPRIVAEAQYQRLTGRLAANRKRCETDLHIAPVRVGSWADETSRIGRF
jgi:hypothetical protein